MRTGLASTILAGLVAGVLAAPASAAIIEYDATLSGLEEVPGNPSAGTGSVEVTIDTLLNTMRVQATFSGLTGNTLASHIHCCGPAGTNATVATTTPSFAGFPLGVTSGSYDNTLDMLDASSYRSGFITDHGGTTASAFAALLAGLNAGEAYFNIHTTIFAGGEIRGQLMNRVPEPASAALLLSALGLLALRRRRG